uniref:Protein ABIL1 n=1 Tax=Kalanchoe fedtschenkoi TaxID=63787 RepID=A0A7N0UFT3_KALFE
MMELGDSSRFGYQAMTFDQVSMERSKNFVKALHELKNLRPQLYSAAEYCEKSYLHSEQKQMVLDNLKDYAVRALVNTVDHLGTVAYKLTDLLEQQVVDLSIIEQNVSVLNQQLLTCQIYMDKEGIRQQQLMATIPRHHKHYMLPKTPASKSLSWHLATETKPSLKGVPQPASSMEVHRGSATAPQLSDPEFGKSIKFSTAQLQMPGALASDSSLQNLTSKEPFEAPHRMLGRRSFDHSNRQIVVQAPIRSRSVLSNFFVKHKSSRMKTGTVS